MKKFLPALFLALVLAMLPFQAQANANTFNETLALEWLQGQQAQDGSFDLWFPPHTAFAAIALNEYEANSSAVQKAANWMAQDVQNPVSWSWAEADIPSTEIYALALLGKANSSLENAYLQLLGMQAPSGGFIGWWTPEGTMEDVASTSFSVLGLVQAGALGTQNKSAAKQFLFSIQNPDGSFNLTKGEGENTLSSLAPDKASATAITLLAFSSLGENASNENISRAVSFLKNQSANCFGNQNHSYVAAVSALALNAFGETVAASESANYLKTLQREDGSFLDSQRSSFSSPVLDTAITLHALFVVNETTNVPSCMQPVATATPTPTPLPTTQPTASPTLAPTATPALTPTVSPTPVPMEEVQFWVSTVQGKPWIGYWETRLVPSQPASPTPTLTQAEQNNALATATPSALAITVAIDFPQGSASDFSQTISSSSCTKAFDCFSLVATLACTWSSYGCFVNAVNGVQSTFEKDGSWWSFKVNGALSQTGVSYYDAKPGDVLELEMTTQNTESQTTSPTPAASASTLPSTSPIPSRQSLQSENNSIQNSSTNNSSNPQNKTLPAPSPTPLPQAFSQNSTTPQDGNANESGKKRAQKIVSVELNAAHKGEPQGPSIGTGFATASDALPSMPALIVILIFAVSAALFAYFKKT